MIMKLFGWMRNGGQNTNVAHNIIKPKQEFCDGLLRIGKLENELTKLVPTKPAAADHAAAAADIDRTIKAIIGRCKDKKAIGKKSVSFLFKKFFVAIPSFHDPLPESRMETLLRAMLNNPQASLPRKHSIQGKVTEDHTGSKWVKMGQN
ncbi:uncharacterized protein LOC110901910 [Helianthus annuus]|uniref:uncharacterized protein LOC110901910 n=1 Tax=Helianthus annuus TaxID=4232 RepID=UPI000B904167|nr:uncharacterized protein LOC110901910 [Helianthus annuus]